MGYGTLCRRQRTLCPSSGRCAPNPKACAYCTCPSPRGLPRSTAAPSSSRAGWSSGMDLQHGLCCTSSPANSGDPFTTFSRKSDHARRRGHYGHIHATHHGRRRRHQDQGGPSRILHILGPRWIAPHEVDGCPRHDAAWSYLRFAKRITPVDAGGSSSIECCWRLLHPLRRPAPALRYSCLECQPRETRGLCCIRAPDGMRGPRTLHGHPDLWHRCTDDVDHGRPRLGRLERVYDASKREP